MDLADLVRRAMSEVLQLGHPGLRAISASVEDPRAPEFRAELARLKKTLAEFRARHGFGRAIAAPQLGAPVCAIALALPNAPSVVINPLITSASSETFTMWDDCMCFPSLLVRLARHASISLEFTDEEGARHTWRDLDRAAAELLQHEIDHLRGVLAIDRALGRDAIITRAAFDAMPDYFSRQVDYVISSSGSG